LTAAYIYINDRLIGETSSRPSLDTSNKHVIINNSALYHVFILLETNYRNIAQILSLKQNVRH